MAASTSHSPAHSLPPEFSFPIDFPYHFHSSCPVDSESSDDDEISVRLTRCLTQQLALDPKNGTKSGSPKSTLSGIGSWSMSSNGSTSGEISPPTTPPGTGSDIWEPICAGAGDASRLNQSSSFYSDRRFVFGDSRLNDQLQVDRSYSGFGRQLWTNQSQQNQIHSRGMNYGRPLNLPHSAWPPLQVQQNKLRSASGGASVFPAGSGGKRGCAGTGVFLPRRFDGSARSNIKSDCSAVTVPSKAGDFKANAAFASKHEASMAAKDERKGDLELESAVKYELCLPPEWIY